MKLTFSIAGAYLGCDAIYHDTEIEYFTPHKFKMLGVMTQMVFSMDNHYSMKFTKLILTPLSKISDEDAVEVAKILGLSYSDTDENYYLDLAGMREYLSELFDGVNRFQDSYTFDKISKLIHYCQSHSIDIGHGYGSNHIPSLIAAGVAVEKETK